MNRGFRIYFDDFSITSRELLMTIIFTAVLICLGIGISSCIEDGVIQKEEKYLTAFQIDNNIEMYNYVMDTKFGNILAYGTATGIDGVTMDDLGGIFWSIARDTEKYTRHSRTVCSNCGETTCCHVEYYWTWDVVDTKKMSISQFTFLGKTYPNGALNIYNPTSYYKTVKIENRIRYVYYTAPISITGTLLSDVSDGTNKNNEWNNMNIEQTIEDKTNATSMYNTIFWIFWWILIGIIDIVYIYYDNEYLEDSIYNY